MANDNKTPAIRFKGYTDDWEQRKLGECAEFNSKSELPDIFEYVDLESVVGTDILSHRTESKSSAPSRAQRLARKGDVFYQTVRPYQKNNCIFENDENNWVFSTGYAQLRPVNNGYFLLTLLQNEDFVKLVLDRCTGTSYPAINSNDLADIDVNIPIDNLEQHKIGDYFRNIDALITLHQHKLEKLQKIKKSMLQKMFPKNGANKPEIRFKGFTDAWEQRKLGEVADIVGGGTPSTSNDDYWDGDIDWYAPAEIADQIYVASSERKITQQGYDNSSAKMLPVGTVLFTSRAGIGKTAILRKEGCTNQGFQSIVPHINELDSYFIFSRSEEMKRYGETVGAGSTFVEVSGKQMANMELMMPTTMEEQVTIGSFFSNLDSLITLHQRKCEKYKNIKSGLIRKLFPTI